jgi:transcription antitermination factor NusG
MSDGPCCVLPPLMEETNGIGPQSIEERAARWYAVFTMARHEKKIAWHLGERQIESFLPLYKTKHRWKNRCTVTVELPLFPNYLFVRIDRDERLRVLSVPSVVSIVSVGREPLPVPDQYIVGLRDGLLAHRIEPHPGLGAGDRVRITTGAMADMIGVLERLKNACRVVLSLEMIGRSVAVEVDLADIEPADAAPRMRIAIAGNSGPMIIDSGV